MWLNLWQLFNSIDTFWLTTIYQPCTVYKRKKSRPLFSESHSLVEKSDRSEYYVKCYGRNIKSRFGTIEKRMSCLRPWHWKWVFQNQLEIRWVKTWGRMPSLSICFVFEWRILGLCRPSDTPETSQPCARLCGLTQANYLITLSEHHFAHLHLGFTAKHCEDA